MAKLSDDAYAENRRTADALGKYKGVGDLPRFTSDAINTNGEKAVHEVADLIGQVHDRDPAQAQELFDKTAQGIAPENRAFLQRALDGHIAHRKAASQTTGSPAAGSPSNNPVHLDIGAGLKETDGSETLSISIDPANAPKVGIAGTAATIPVAASGLGEGLAAGAARAAAGVAGTAAAGATAAAATLVVPMNEGQSSYDIKMGGRDTTFKHGPGDLHSTVWYTDPETGKAVDSGYVTVERARYKGDVQFDFVPKGALSRTDIADPMPTTETFPAHNGNPTDTISAGQPAEPQKSIQIPPLEVPDTSEFDKPLANPNQSDNPTFKDLQTLEYDDFDEPVEFAKGDKVPPKTQEALDGLDPATAQLVKEAGLSDGTALAGDQYGIHIETGKSVSHMDDDFRAIVRKFGDDPYGPKVRENKKGDTIYDGPNGIKVLPRPDSQGGMTIEIQVPSEAGRKNLHKIKRRYK